MVEDCAVAIAMFPAFVEDVQVCYINVRVDLNALRLHIENCTVHSGITGVSVFIQ